MHTNPHEQNATDFDDFSIKSLDLHIVTNLIENPSITDQEIADKLGVSRQTVNRRKNSKAVQGILKKTLSIPEDEIRRLTVKAFTRLEKLLDHDDPKIKLAATLSLIKLSDKLITSENCIELPEIFKFPNSRIFD